MNPHLNTPCRASSLTHAPTHTMSLMLCGIGFFEAVVRQFLAYACFRLFQRVLHLS